MVTLFKNYDDNTLNKGLVTGGATAAAGTLAIPIAGAALMRQSDKAAKLFENRVLVNKLKYAAAGYGIPVNPNAVAAGAPLLGSYYASPSRFFPRGFIHNVPEDAAGMAHELGHATAAATRARGKAARLLEHLRTNIGESVVMSGKLPLHLTVGAGLGAGLLGMSAGAAAIPAAAVPAAVAATLLPGEISASTYGSGLLKKLGASKAFRAAAGRRSALGLLSYAALPVSMAGLAAASWAGGHKLRNYLSGGDGES